MITIPRAKAENLLKELAQTVRTHDKRYLEFLIRTNDNDIVTNNNSLVEAFRFFDDVGMLD